MAQRHAEIAGAGFAGLTAAAALVQRGWSVRVHERAAEAREFGAGIWTFENGVRVLNAIGAADEAFEGALHTPSFETRNTRGQQVNYLGFGTHETGGRLLCVTRRHLHGAVLNAALRSGVEVVTSSKAIGATPEGELLIDGGKSYQADLVIAADGAGSSVRDSLGLLKRRWRHTSGAIRVNVSRKPEEVDHPIWSLNIDFVNGIRRVLFTPCSKEVLYIGFRGLAADKEASRVPVNKKAWSNSFPDLAEFFDRIPDSGPDAGRWDYYETLWLHRWSKGRCAVIGDAAHAMLPGLGQGCGTALQNALSLATFLDEHKTMEEAFAAWEQRERPITEHIQIWSRIGDPPMRIPEQIIRFAYSLPIIKPWTTRNRTKPSLHTPHGTEGDERWLPKAMRGESQVAEDAS